MQIVLAIVVMAIAALGLFLMWFMIKALQVDFQFLKGDIGRYAAKKRKYMWSSAFAIPVCVAVGGLVGALSGGLSSSVKGDVIGSAVAYAFIALVAAFVGRPEKPSAR
jgi:predicted branched-subunit amino acid permease